VLLWFLALLPVVVCGLVGLSWWHFKHRAAHYRALADRRSSIVCGHEPVLAMTADTEELAGGFQRDFMIRVEDFLDPESLRRLREEGVAAMPLLKRSYVPTHKKGGTVSYEQVHHVAPHCLAFYHSPVVQAWVSRVVGHKVSPAGDHDQSSCSLLYYTEEGDHIHWHFDHNFYRGRQFTALLSLVNRGGNGGLSASRLMRKDAEGKEIAFETAENTLMLFEGQRVVHRVSPAAAGDQRIVLSMTFNSDPRISVTREVKRRVKDTAFFGLRVLWH
jgi:hypothetical protein